MLLADMDKDEVAALLDKFQGKNKLNCYAGDGPSNWRDHRLREKVLVSLSIALFMHYYL